MLSWDVQVLHSESPPVTQMANKAPNFSFLSQAKMSISWIMLSLVLGFVRYCCAQTHGQGTQEGSVTTGSPRTRQWQSHAWDSELYK